MKIFELFIEVEPLKDNRVLEGCIGAVVYIYVPAENLEESIYKMKKTIKTDDFRLLNIDYVRTVNLEEWEGEENEECPTLEELKQSLIDGTHKYSVFHGYKSLYDN